MTIRRFVVPITVDESGDATVYTPHVSGTLQSIHYIKDDFADGVDFVVTTEDTAQTLWSEESVNASAIRRPRGPTHTTAGAASLYAGGGTAVNRPIAIGREQIKIVVADGGNATSGTLHVVVAS